MKRQIIFAAALLMAGCGGNPDVACNIVQKSAGTTVHLCEELDNLDPSQITAGQQLCSDQKGALVNACSTDGIIGMCTTSSQNGATGTVYIFPDGGVTASIAEHACQQSNGTWTPR